MHSWGGWTEKYEFRYTCYFNVELIYVTSIFEPTHLTSNPPFRAETKNKTVSKKCLFDSFKTKRSKSLLHFIRHVSVCIFSLLLICCKTFKFSALQFSEWTKTANEWMNQHVGPWLIMESSHLRVLTDKLCGTSRPLDEQSRNRGQMVKNPYKLLL